MCFFHEGEILEQGTPEEIFRAPSARRPGVPRRSPLKEAKMAQPAYAQGTGDVPLLGRDDRRALWAHASRAHGDREALVSRHQGMRWTYAELDARGRAASRAALLARGVAQGRPGRHLGAELRRVGRSSSTRPRSSARSWSTSTRPTARTSSSTCCASPACALLVAPPAFKTSDYGAMVGEVAATLPGARASGRSRRAGLGRAARRRRRRRRRRARAREAALRRSTTRSTSSTRRGTTGLPEGRDALAPQHPQQRLLRRRAARLHASATASASRCRSTTASAW